MTLPANDKPKLLVLAPRFPYPPIGGDRLRIYRLCKQIAIDCELTLLCLCDSEEEMKYAVPEDGVFTRVERIFHGRLRRLWGCVRTLPSGAPFQVGYYWNREFEQRFRILSRSHHGLYAHLIRMGAYLENSKLPKILEMTDAISLSYARHVAYRDPLFGTAYRWEASRLIRCERKLIEKCDLTVLVSKLDRDFLLSGSDSQKVLVSSNGVDTQALPFDYSPDGRTIVFIGKNTAFHNRDGILYFTNNILPLIRSRRPGVKFKVVGQIGRSLQRNLERRGVVVAGAVQEIAGAARNASVGVCPVRIGAGVQNKILEYMSLGIPTVTSSVGLEGLDAIPGVHLLVADTPENWADQICGLFADPTRGESLAVAARHFVERHHDWSSLAVPLRARIADLLKQQGTTIGMGRIAPANMRKGAE